jgi:hypothetical protein
VVWPSEDPFVPRSSRRSATAGGEGAPTPSPSPSPRRGGARAGGHPHGKGADLGDGGGGGGTAGAGAGGGGGGDGGAPDGDEGEAGEGEGEGEGEGGSAFPVDVIARLISEWYLGLAPEAQAAFVAEALRVGSFMGEVNRSDSEHIIAIPKYGTPCTDAFVVVVVFYVCVHMMSCWSPCPKMPCCRAPACLGVICAFLLVWVSCSRSHMLS